jgi:hypothetical protein
MIRIEMVTSRDPDSESDFQLFVNGKPLNYKDPDVSFEIYSTDPGAGHLAIEWFDSFNHDFRAASSDAVRQAVAANYVGGYRSEYIDHKPEDEDHQVIVRALLEVAANQVPDAVALVLRRMDGDEFEPHHSMFEIGYRLADVRLTGGRSMFDVDPIGLQDLQARLTDQADEFGDIPWTNDAFTDEMGTAVIEIPAEIREAA